MTERPSYNVLATPEGEKFWVVRIFGLPEGKTGVTQALREKGAEDIEAMARECIALQLEVDENSFDLNIVVQKPDPELTERLKAGIEQAKRGETHDLGSFSQYLTENEGDNG